MDINVKNLIKNLIWIFTKWILIRERKKNKIKFKTKDITYKIIKIIKKYKITENFQKDKRT